MVSLTSWYASSIFVTRNGNVVVRLFTLSCSESFSNLTQVNRQKSNLPSSKSYTFRLPLVLPVLLAEFVDVVAFLVGKIALQLLVTLI